MMNAAIDLPLSINDLVFRYRRREMPSIYEITLEVKPGELVLIAGSSGCGKTTLMRCINGLAPRIYQGEMSGDVQIFGKPVQDLSMSDLSQRVGTLLQDPERQIVSSHVFNEVAFGLENLALPRQRIIYRVDETLDYLRISHLRDRETFSLSGGEKQKVALAGILAMQPKLLLLDEPLASLDPMSASEALSLFRKLADDGIAVVIVEHRVEDVLAISPDNIIYLEEGKIAYRGGAEGLLNAVDISKVKLPADAIVKRSFPGVNRPFSSALPSPNGKELVHFEHVDFRYRPEDELVLQDINFSVHRGDIIAILGPNGAGKTTLVKHALGLLKPTQGFYSLRWKIYPRTNRGRSSSHHWICFPKSFANALRAYRRGRTRVWAQELASSEGANPGGCGMGFGQCPHERRTKNPTPRTFFWSAETGQHRGNSGDALTHLNDG